MHTCLCRATHSLTLLRYLRCIGGFHLTHRHASKKNKILNNSIDKSQEIYML